jgi:pimeloyl-ACP methyl ester carboxylesterase
VDSLKHTKYLPHIEAADIETMVTYLKQDKRFKNCKIILYGMSEGTIIAPMVAERKKVKIDALFLHGYVHENLFDIIKWQLTNEKSVNDAMNMINSVFDKNGDKVLDREEYESEDPAIVAYKKPFFQNSAFESIDIEVDSFYNAQDILKARKIYHPVIMTKIAENDEYWIWNNYVRVTIGWLREHFALESNKTRLLRENIPIYVFHGIDDMNVPVESVYVLELRFKTCNKSNLKTFIFDFHNHDLNFQDWIKTKEYSPGLQKIFETSAEI